MRRVRAARLSAGICRGCVARPRRRAGGAASPPVGRPALDVLVGVVFIGAAVPRRAVGRARAASLARRGRARRGCSPPRSRQLGALHQALLLVALAARGRRGASPRVASVRLVAAAAVATGLLDQWSGRAGLHSRSRCSPPHGVRRRHGRPVPSDRRSAATWCLAWWTSRRLIGWSDPGPRPRRLRGPPGRRGRGPSPSPAGCPPGRSRSPAICSARSTGRVSPVWSTCSARPGRPDPAGPRRRRRRPLRPGPERETPAPRSSVTRGVAVAVVEHRSDRPRRLRRPPPRSSRRCG